MARRRMPRPQRGGKESKHSRSLGVVLERVRQDFDGCTVEELDAHFRGMDVDSECYGFLEPAGVKKDSELGNRISAYECATRYPQWGTIVRYGTISGTWPGILLLISGFYACFRDAANPKKDAAKELDAARIMARKTVAMALAAQEMVETFGSDAGLADKLACRDGVEWHDEKVRREHARLVVQPLLDAYRAG